MLYTFSFCRTYSYLTYLPLRLYLHMHKHNIGTFLWTNRQWFMIVPTFYLYSWFLHSTSIMHLKCIWFIEMFPYGMLTPLRFCGISADRQLHRIIYLFNLIWIFLAMFLIISSLSCIRLATQMNGSKLYKISIDL